LISGLCWVGLFWTKARDHRPSQTFEFRPNEANSARFAGQWRCIFDKIEHTKENKRSES
jgi:hypothetical protein